MKPEISVVIPTIDEESVFQLVKDIRRLLGNGTEIIIVDKSGNAYFRRLQKTGARVIRQRDRGVERAIMMGLRAARGNVLASIDADGTHDPAGLKDGFRLVKEGKADLVLGNRMGHLERGSMSWYIIIGNSILSWLFRVLYKTEVHDVLTGLFVTKRSAFNEIRNIEPYRAGIAFFAIELARRGCDIKEVGIKYYRRRYGSSKLTRSKFVYGINVASHIIRQLRDYSPLAIFGGLGVIVIIIGLILGLNVFYDFLRTGRFAETGRALIAFFMVMLGFLFWISGLILDLLLEIERKIGR
ncbi:MAG: glycosyltransferase family 2 protein [Candidatus Micrarchaeota archaeon]|nr:glycosyltransferase family 2 protein [Candidatus Micrarchaeota archaeon]MDE1824450.1 glycosyltransferase family 2 protein [Candidatus Micrarchaeota archaeon]MDE1849617.1 glycosyltransferase family 2 protein [Candidatus Micrarchaeota archaeon]